MNTSSYKYKSIILNNLKGRFKRMINKGTLSAPSGSEGFTLIELMIVVAIIALIGGIVTVNVMSKLKEAQVSTTKTQIKQLSVVLDDFRRVCGFYPTTDQGLDSLVHAPSGRPCKNYDPEGFIKQVPNDAWHNPFMYTSDGNTYEIKSFGADGKEGGSGVDKDISSNDTD